VNHQLVMLDCERVGRGDRQPEYQEAISQADLEASSETER
jgi:hypothetical protein